MTREEAIRSYTSWAAYAAFEEHIKGSIELGKLADFIVIDRDITLGVVPTMPSGVAQVTASSGLPPRTI